MSHHRITLTVAAIFGLTVVSSVRADVSLASLFRDGAVLQRDKPLPIWGWGDAGETVRVEFRGHSEETVVDPRGEWRVSLPPTQGSSTPQDLVVVGHNRLRVTGVLVGDVWLCSGQSNMNFVVKDALNAEAEIKAANHPLIHYFGIANDVAEKPQRETPGSWQPAVGERVGSFSAVAYFFARDIQSRLGVPIGIIKATPGGSGIEAWMSHGIEGDRDWAEILAHRRKVLAAYPRNKAAYDQALAEWTAAAARGPSNNDNRPHVPEGPLSRNAPCGLYYSSIYPLVPYAIRGFIWYQGEGNASRFVVYRKLFPKMIEQWREDFGQGPIPFLFVQLANFDLAHDPTHQQWAFQREAQAAALSVPNTAMTVAIDVGDPATIHPRNKQEVGRRLASLALNHAYGIRTPSDAPQAAKFSIEPGTIRVTFRPANGLVVRGERIADLEVAGEDRQFHPAEGKLNGDNLIVSSAAVASPVAVRYLWRNAPTATLFDRDGLPVAPFRSDSW